MRQVSGREATIDDLHRERGKAELVSGRIVRMPPAGGLHGYASARITVSLAEYARRTARGCALGDNVCFVVNLPHRRSFSPDAAYHLGPLTMDFIDGAPVLAVEVRSTSDHGPAAERAMAAKRADYFAAGTLVVWDVDLVGADVVRVHRASDPDRPRVYRRGEHAEAEPAVLGWSMPVDALFP
jgi:Uma2 family endonuclease